jgi:hypothetical protein
MFLAATSGAGSPPVPRVIPLDPGDLSEAISWTPMAHTCGCVTDWGWDPGHADPLSFMVWCSVVVTEECPWHAARRPHEDRTPILVQSLPHDAAFYAQSALGTDVELGRRITSGVQELLAMTEDATDEWLGTRLVDLILNRRA